MLVRMYTESARRTPGLEIMALTRCEGDDEGVGTAAKCKIGYKDNLIDRLTCELRFPKDNDGQHAKSPYKRCHK